MKKPFCQLLDLGEGAKKKISNEAGFRVYILVGLLEVIFPVGNTPDEHSGIDEVELVGVRPRVLEIIYEEADVGGNTGRWNG